MCRLMNLIISHWWTNLFLQSNYLGLFKEYLSSYFFFFILQFNSKTIRLNWCITPSDFGVCTETTDFGGSNHRSLAEPLDFGLTIDQTLKSIALWSFRDIYTLKAFTHAFSQNNSKLVHICTLLKYSDRGNKTCTHCIIKYSEWKTYIQLHPCLLPHMEAYFCPFSSCKTNYVNMLGKYVYKQYNYIYT